MPDEREAFPHLLVRNAVHDEVFRRGGGGNPRIRDVETRAHGQARLHELDRALTEQDEQRAGVSLTDDELRSLGVVIVLEGADATFPLKVDSLQRFSQHRNTPRRPRWLLLAVTPADHERPERAIVWVSDESRGRFLQLFEQYIDETTSTGHPRRQELVANITRIRGAVLDDLWQSSGEPPRRERVWWELWLHPSEDAVDLLRRFVGESPGMQLSARILRLNDRTVTWLRATWDELHPLPFTRVPLAEIRSPEFVDTVEDLSPEDRDELTEDLADRVSPSADATAPAVCLLDTGVRRTHVLLAGSLSAVDMHSIVDEFGADEQNHGTPMAGLSLYGPLDAALLGTQPTELHHRLESVKVVPDAGPGHDPLAYGLVTAQATALPEAVATRRRVFSMPITAEPDRPGEPTLWSASLDALVAGTDISRSDDGIELLGAPDPTAARLFVVSAGNVREHHRELDYRDACDLATAEDPAQAWNALTVGAYTELTGVPSDPSFADWSPVGSSGDISPHSRTSVLFARPWPIKPEICMEGGNVLTDGADSFAPDHPLLSLRTTDNRDDTAIGSANATSAATAQAARLGALAYVRYPDYWPETIRALLVHGAHWSPAMRTEIDGASSKAAKLKLLRRYGWGVPTEGAVLDSSRQAVTTVTQDSFVPFDEEHRARRFRLHQLPWPVEALRGIAGGDVALRVTLSYFIEPTASRRGWRQRYAYASHGLRFDLKLPTETTEAFVSRVNREAQVEEDGSRVSAASGADRWLLGANRRHLGSLHQDVWEGSGADLADSGVIAVYPVGGWWKNNKRRDRQSLTVRYALVVSLRTDEQGVDLYTPIAAELRIPVENIAYGG